MRRNKFNVSPKEARTVNGVVYDSKKEADYAAELDLERVAKPGKMWWARQCQFVLEGGVKYVADFIVWREGEETEVVDVKGMRTAQYKRSKKQVEARYGFKIVEV